MAVLQPRTTSSIANGSLYPRMTMSNTRTSLARQPVARGLPGPVATAASPSWSISGHQRPQHLSAHVCHANSATSSSPTSSNRRVRGQAKPAPQQQQQQQQQQPQQQPKQQAQQQQAEPQQRPIRVAADSSISGVAKAVLYQLHHFGTSEVWATSAANHFAAVAALAEAHRQLQQRRQRGLAAVASLSASDQPVADEQKKGLKKLTLTVTITDPMEQEVWECTPADAAAASSSTDRISTNRTKVAADVMQLLLHQLSAKGEADAAAIVECRGEQSVTRALKAALSLQASQGMDMVIQPWPGQVVDVVAEKRGEQGRLVDGLLLRMSWAEQQQGQK